MHKKLALKKNQSVLNSVGPKEGRSSLRPFLWSRGENSLFTRSDEQPVPRKTNDQGEISGFVAIRQAKELDKSTVSEETKSVGFCGAPQPE